MSSLAAAPAPTVTAPATLVPPPAPGAPLTKKALTADHPTWCPGCGDFAVLASFYRVLEKLNYPHEKIVTFAGIGCSSRFPYFVNTHGGHFLHGRALPFAAGISLGNDDLHVFAFGGDGDGFSIGGNHLVHTARKNVNLTYVIMDNSVYGLTKKQTSPTSPVGFKSKTDPWGAFDQPINPMRTLLNSGATFVARSHATQVNHMTEMMLRAAKHNGFSVVEILSECVEFFEGAFDAANPRKGGSWTMIEAPKNDGTPEDANRHDVTDEVAAFKLAQQTWPGSFGVFYENKTRPTKNKLEADLVAKTREKTKNASDLQLLQNTFARLR
jgi:2-oxoglutarate ferredoxin oxidoreductase subunit beta